MTERHTIKGGTDGQSGTKMDEADMDDMVARASVPNLASLFRKGKEKGLIQAQQEYGHTT